MPQEPDVNSRGRKTWSIVSLCVIAAWSLHLMIGSSRWLYSTVGDLGFVSDLDGRLVAVDPKGAAADAGLRMGDRIDLRSASPSQRYFLSISNIGFLTLTVAPGTRMAFPIVRPTGSRLVTLTSKPLAISTSDKVLAIASDLTKLALLLLGTVVVLLRPSVMAWGLYWFTFFVAPSTPYLNLWYASLPVGWGFVDKVVFDLEVALIWVGPLVFALRFPRDLAEGWRHGVERFVPLLLALSFAGLLAGDIAQTFFGADTQALGASGAYFIFGIAAVAICALASTYLGAPRADRQRIKWALLGLFVGLGSSPFLNGLEFFFPTALSLTLGSRSRY